MTEREKDEFIEQLRGEVSRWHHAYDALMVERNQLAGDLAQCRGMNVKLIQDNKELQSQVLNLGNELTKLAIGKAF